MRHLHGEVRIDGLMMSVTSEHQICESSAGQRTSRIELRTENCLRRCSLLRRMPQASSLDQAVKIFGEIGSVVSGTLQSLRHKNHVEARGIIRRVLREMLLEQAMADAVNLFVH